MKVNFREIANKVRPKDHIDILRPLLPDRYSPLQPNGNGLQSVYLTEVPTRLAEVLIGLIGRELAPIALAARDVKPVSADDLDFWERKLEQELANDSTIRETERMAIIRARNGQGLFKQRVSEIESRCRITGVENPVHLVASHCKPWRDSTNEARLNGENGLLLTPSIDHLFDRGFLGFGQREPHNFPGRPSSLSPTNGNRHHEGYQCGRFHQRSGPKGSQRPRTSGAESWQRAAGTETSERYFE